MEKPGQVERSTLLGGERAKRVSRRQDAKFVFLWRSLAPWRAGGPGDMFGARCLALPGGTLDVGGRCMHAASLRVGSFAKLGMTSALATGRPFRRMVRYLFNSMPVSRGSTRSPGLRFRRPSTFAPIPTSTRSSVSGSSPDGCAPIVAPFPITAFRSTMA